MSAAVLVSAPASLGPASADPASGAVTSLPELNGGTATSGALASSGSLASFSPASDDGSNEAPGLPEHATQNTVAAQTNAQSHAGTRSIEPLPT